MNENVTKITEFKTKINKHTQERKKSQKYQNFIYVIFP